MASLCGEVMNRCVPIIVILGGTGTGKSKLGIQIAKRIGGEIISADSMQVYKGLNILTNKVTEDEKDGVVHHLMDFVVPPRTYTVVDFRNEALPIVDRLLEQKRCPVVVGGTNYYIESLLWKVLITNCTETSLVSENQNGMEKLAFRLGLRPFSGTFKRKVDDKDKTPLDVKGRLLLTVREVILMSNYPEKVFDILFDKLKSCTEDTCEKLVTSVCVRLGNNDDLLQKLKASIDDKHCQVVKKNLIEVVALGKQTKVLVEEWQTSNPTLNLEDALKTPDKVNLKDVSTVEESLQDVHQRLKSLIAPYVQRFVSEFGSAVRLEIDVEDLPSPDLHNFLIQVDEQQARYLHPNNKRKIVRSLVVWAESGRKHSDILNEQKRDGSFLGGPLRYKDTIIFWLTCDQEVLNARLDERIDQMIERGLVEELLDFYKKYKPGEDQYTKGIFQSIGFRNFRGYLSLDDEKRKGPEGEKMLQEGRELFRIDTKRYVKQQNKWVRNRFLNCPTREVPPVYNLSTTDIDRWTEDVLEPALEVVLDKLEGSEAAEGAARLLQPVAMEAASRQTVSEVLNLKHGLHYCDICQRTLVGQKQFDDHIQSARHRKAVRRKDNQANKAT